MLRHALLAGLSLFVGVLTAQSTYTLAGAVRDAASGEELIGATLRLLPGNTGTTSNEYGFYSLTAAEGSYTLSVSYVGYRIETQRIELNANRTLDIRLSGGEILQEVVVSAEKENGNLTGTELGMEKLNMREISQVPMLFGERDVLKAIQLLPGVKPAGDGNAGFYVRGGGLDQNLILLDEAPVYNASHLFGFFSTFNSDAIKDATIYKGNQPAQYGGRLSSVLDIKMKEGNDRDYHVNGGIGLIASRLSVEGPLVSEHGSFLVSGRRTYADAFLRLSSDSSLRNNKLYFYDLNLKTNYRIGDRDRLFLSGYFGRDALALGDNFGIQWGNQTGTLRWNHLYGPRLFSNTSLIYSQYDFRVDVSAGQNDFSIVSNIEDWNIRQEFQWFPNPACTVRFGFNSIHHAIKPGEIFSADTVVFKGGELQRRFGLENALWAQADWNVTSQLKVTCGLRLSTYTLLGAGDFYSFDANRNIASTRHYGPGEPVQTYLNPQPRLALNYSLNAVSAVKASYARHAQYLRLLSNATAGNPTDRWVSVTNNIKPGISDQVSLGWYRNFAGNQYEFSVETYYKWLQNETDYRNDANLYGNPYFEADLIYGQGRAYGVEFFLKKKSGALTGWLSYTLSRTERQFTEVNAGSWFPARQDRTHDLSLTTQYQLSPHWSVSANFVYYTGDAATFPSGKYSIQDNTVFLYTERNGYRMPAYHRLDLGASWQGRKDRRMQSEWAFSIYNVYGRENAYTINFEQDTYDLSKTNAVRTALFKMVPSVSYNFKF